MDLFAFYHINYKVAQNFDKNANEKPGGYYNEKYPLGLKKDSTVSFRTVIFRNLPKTIIVVFYLDDFALRVYYKICSY